MNRRTFFSTLFTTGVLLNSMRHPAKAHQATLSTKEALDILIERALMPAWWYVVPNYPLTATQDDRRWIIRPDGTRSELVWRNKLFRDAAGRVRVEEYFISPGNTQGQHLRAFIADPVAGELKIVFFEKSVATKYSPSFDSDVVSKMVPDMQHHADQLYENIQIASLGSRTLEGFECSGLLITASVRRDKAQGGHPTQETLEEWVSPKLSTPLLTEAGSRSQGIQSERVVKLLDIKEDKPDSALFEIPSGFRIVDPKEAPKYAFSALRK